MIESAGPAWDQPHSKKPLYSGVHDSPVRFDFCIVFKCQEKGQLTQDAEINIRKAIAAGLETRVFFSVQKDEIYVEVGCTLERLRVFAEQIGKVSASRLFKCCCLCSVRCACFCCAVRAVFCFKIAL
jgi:hypothetical protein